MIVAYTRNESDLRALERRRTVEVVHLCHTFAEVATMGVHPSVRFILADVDSWPSSAPEEFAGMLAGCRFRAPVIVRFDMRKRCVPELYALARLSLDVRDSHRGDEELGDRIVATGAGQPATAAFALLRRIDAGAPPALRDAMGLMVVFSRRRASEAAVAAALGVSTGTLRALLAAHRRQGFALPNFARICATFLAVHLLWQRERAGPVAKDAIVSAGFAAPARRDNYLRNNLGMTQRQIINAGGIQRLLAQVSSWFGAPARL